MTSKAACKVIEIKISARQLRDYKACADLCGLSLEHWISQCADVRAADVIDALQAEHRQQRTGIVPPAQLDEETLILGEPVKKPPSNKQVAKSEKQAIVKAAMAYNDRFRRKRKEQASR